MKFMIKPVLVLLIFTASLANANELNQQEEISNITSETVEFQPLSLYNFKREVEEEILNPQELSVEKGKEFIPPLPVAEQLYLSYVNQGAEPLEAVTYTYVELRKAMAELQEHQSN